MCRKSAREERKLTLRDRGLPSSALTLARFDLDERRAGLWSCIVTTWCKDPQASGVTALANFFVYNGDIRCPLGLTNFPLS